MQRLIWTLGAAVAALVFLLLPPWGTAQSQQSNKVQVINLPTVQQIEGKVSVVGTIRHGAIERRVNLIVPPVERDDVADLVEVEPIATDGFTAVTMSLHGQVRGTPLRAGAVGAILVPAEASVSEILNQRGVFHFPLEVTSEIAVKEEIDFNDQDRFPLGFPRYRIFLYNSTDRTVDAHLYLYLTQ